MADSSLAHLTIRELAPLLRAGKLSPVELARATLARIERENPRLNAYLAVFHDEALEEAREAEREIRAGRYRGPLHGIPVSLKDLFHMRGRRTTAGSKIFAQFIPDGDAAAVERLRAAGAVIVGKTNLHELAYGITNNNPHYGPTRNPHDTARIPGGSSGGSGAAVAAGLCAASLGTDTGGSIRIPASFCGVVGLKPAFGRVSRRGVFPLGRSLDHVGPLARSAWDTAAVLQAIAGHDPADQASADHPVPDFLSEIELGIQGLLIGVPDNYFFDRLDPEVEAAVRSAIAAMERAGARLEPITLARIAEATEAARSILLAEAAALYEKELRDRPQDFGSDVRALLEQGRQAPATDYAKALLERREFQRELNGVFQKVDLIVTPAAPVTAPLIGQAEVRIQDHSEDARLASTRLVRAFNMAGVPALCLPCGRDARGLPVGLQIIGRPFDEATVLRAAHAVNCGLRISGACNV